MGIRGGLGLAKRFAPGTVISPWGSQYQVGPGNGAVESQFSLVDPDGAAVLFSTQLAAKKTGGTASPVATAFAYGRGRMMYVGFTFENLASADLLPAFLELMDATGLSYQATGTNVATTPPLNNTVPTTQLPTKFAPVKTATILPASATGQVTDPNIANASPVKKKGPATGVPPKAAGLTAATPDPTQPPPAASTTPTPSAGPYRLTSVKVTITTGNDNKEALSVMGVTLNRVGDTPTAWTGESLFIGGTYNAANSPEFKTYSDTVFDLTPQDFMRTEGYEYLGQKPWHHLDTTLDTLQSSGLRLEIWYSPNFILDAWKIDQVILTLEFKDDQGRLHPTMGNKTVTFSNVSTLLTNSTLALELETDGFFLPKTVFTRAEVIRMPMP
jgi:hypothetical protein